MKSIRLNKDTRLAIIDNIMAAYSKENVRPPEVKSSAKGLAEAIHDWYVKTNKKLFNRFEKLDVQYPGLISRDSSISYKDTLGNLQYIYYSTGSINCRDENGNWVDCVYHPKLSKGCIIDLSNPDTKIPEEIQTVLDHIAGTKKEVKAQKKALQDYNLKYDNYRESVSQVIYGVNTTKQLLEAWPKVKRFLPSGLAEPNSIQLPAINVAALDSKLGK